MTRALRRFNRLVGALAWRHFAGEDVLYMAPEVAGRPPPLRRFARMLAALADHNLSGVERSMAQAARTWLARKNLKP